MKRWNWFSLAAVVAALVLAVPVQAAVKLPAIFGDHMVLQRDLEIPVWGWDQPGQEVSVTLGDASAKAKADEQGRWLVRLPKQKAGGPLVLSISGSDKQEFKDVLVGEVWICSGQSNMEFTVGGAVNAQEEISSADHPKIRHIKIQHVPADKPQDDVKSNGWQVCSPKTVGGFTAVGYFFGRELQKELDVPIGLIGSNWGGTRIEPWTPPAGFKAVPALKNIADKLDEFPQKNNQGQVNHQSPLALYNGMIHPLVPYAIRGAIWYQGESNNGEGMLYADKMKALVEGWRTVWNEGDFPFYWVQLAPYHYGGNGENLAGIWEAQTAALAIPNTGMAVTVDVGNLKDIHPKNKQDVGKRLALWALAKDYGRKDLVYSGPLYKGMKIEGNKIRLSFDHVGSGLISRDDKPLTWFTIAGPDGKFVEAQATIDGDTVVVTADEVKEPKSVRFAFNQDAEPNLANKEGLPASPFRTK